MVWYTDLILVCTWWSKVATRCPRMWYHIVSEDLTHKTLGPSTIPYYPRKVLQRSGETPLHLYMTALSQPTSESVPQWVIKNQPNRVEALHVTLGDARRPRDLLELLATPLSSLRLLAVDAHYSPYPRVTVKGMPTILSGEVLKLDALIWSVGVPFLPGNIFPNLAHLNLHKLGSDSPNLDKLLRLLSNCPRLETLVFGQSSLDVITDMGPDRGPVPLKHLRALWVHGRYLAVNTAFTFLCYLELPKDATVRLSNLSEVDTDDPSEPPTVLPFLSQMDCPTRLDIMNCDAGSGSEEILAFHFVVVGPRSRFWLHLTGGPTVTLHYLTLLYKMLAKETIETVRVSVFTTRQFAFLPLILGHLPSLTTLLVRHSARSSPAVDRAGIAALARALRPRRHPANDGPASREPSEGSAEGSSEDDEDESNGDTGWGSADDSEQGDHPDGDQAQDHAEQPLDTLGGTPGHHGIDFSVETVTSVPVPQLKVVGLELTCSTGTSLEPFVRAMEDRKKCGHPLVTMQHNLVGVDMRYMDEMKEYVVKGVSAVNEQWFPTIDEGWRMQNDYWRLHPVPWDDFVGWGFCMEEW